MNAQIRSQPDGIALPASDEVLATIRGYDDLVEAFRIIKDRLGLSNAKCDELAGLVEGHTDKLLGPTGAKSLSRATVSRFCTVFAVKLEMKIDIDQAARMNGRWEARDASNVRPGGPKLSKKLLERAKPLVLKAAGRCGAEKRNSMLSAKHRTDIARKAADALWKKRGRKRTRKAATRRAWYRKTMQERLKSRFIKAARAPFPEEWKT